MAEPTYGSTDFRGWTLVHMFLSGLLNAWFMHIKNRFHDRFMVNLVKSASPV